MKDLDIETYAHDLANAMPERPPEGARTRKRFVVGRVWREGARYIGLEVEVDEPEFLAAFDCPGQYVTFQCGASEPRFLVIASAPGDEKWHFLIDRESEIGEVAERIEVGQRVVLSPPEGRGYPAADAVGRSVLFFTTGAGIASVRPVLEYWRTRPDEAPARLAVYYGENDVDDFAYVGEFADWRAQGARIYQAIENLPEPEEGFRYVQHAFEEDAPNLDNALIFVSGAPVMMELMIGKLLRMGVPKDHIYINV